MAGASQLELGDGHAADDLRAGLPVDARQWSAGPRACLLPKRRARSARLVPTTSRTVSYGGGRRVRLKAPTTDGKPAQGAVRPSVALVAILRRRPNATSGAGFRTSPHARAHVCRCTWAQETAWSLKGTRRFAGAPSTRVLRRLRDRFWQRQPHALANHRRGLSSRLSAGARRAMRAATMACSVAGICRAAA